MAPAALAKPGFGNLYHDGEVVRTVVPPAAMPQPGTDPFYAVTDGVEDQLGIVGVAPGDPEYRGGKWAFNEVTWNEGSMPELLTSEADVLAAEEAGYVTVTRTPEDPMTVGASAIPPGEDDDSYRRTAKASGLVSVPTAAS